MSMYEVHCESRAEQVTTGGLVKPTPRQKVVCVDFDGVIHSFTSPWSPGCPPLDPPVPGAFDFLFDCLSANFRVIIFSCRCETQEGENGIRDWFFKNNFPVGRGALLEYACKKPIADIYIDDRAYEFRGIFPTLDFIERFKPWNK